MSGPIVEQTGNVFRLTWENEQVVAEVRRLADRAYGPGGEVTWLSVSPGQKGLLHQGYLGLTSTRGKDQLAAALEARQQDKDWRTLVEQFAVIVLRAFRRGSPPVLLQTADSERECPALAVSPLIFAGHPYVFFGDPATSKSYLALILTSIAICPQVEVPPFSCQQPMKAVYLDWESSAQDQAFRLSRLAEGFRVELGGLITYRHCVSPLAHDIESVQEVVRDAQANWVVVDSLGPAAGGDLNSPQSAQEFYGALRTLSCTSLILAHNAKNADLKHRSIFGSGFFNALARGTAEVRRYQDAGDDVAIVGIYPRKANFSRLERPIGLKLCFEGKEGAITVARHDLKQVARLSDALPSGERILRLLTSSETALTPKQMADRLGLKDATARKAVARLRYLGKVVALDDHRYGAAVGERLRDCD